MTLKLINRWRNKQTTDTNNQAAGPCGAIDDAKPTHYSLHTDSKKAGQYQAISKDV